MRNTGPELGSCQSLPGPNFQISSLAINFPFFDYQVYTICRIAVHSAPFSVGCERCRFFMVHQTVGHDDLPAIQFRKAIQTVRT